MQLQTFIVIVNYNTWQDAIECLESVLRSSEKNFKIILVDNGSPNDSFEKLIEWAQGKTVYTLKNKSLSYIFHKERSLPLTFQALTEDQFNTKDISAIPKLITFVKAKANNGFAAGNNIALRKIKEIPALVWLLNPDLVIEPNTFGNLRLSFLSSSIKSVFGALVKNYEKPTETLNLGAGKLNFNLGTVNLLNDVQDLPTIDYISGGSLFTHSYNFKELGLLDESYFLYWEETDWCYQAKLKGYFLSICLDAVVFDKGSTSIGRGYLAEYYYTYNALKFSKKYNTGKINSILFFNFFRFSKRMVSGKFKRAKAILDATLKFVSNSN